MADSSTTVREGGVVITCTATRLGVLGSARQCIGEIRKVIITTNSTITASTIAVSAIAISSQQLDGRWPTARRQPSARE